jgi:hypothetical protein
MKNTQNITIGLLVVTASILTTLLVAGYLYTEPAYAISTAKDGDYIIATGSYDESRDFVYVLDIATERMAIYLPDHQNAKLVIGGTPVPVGSPVRR